MLEYVIIYMDGGESLRFNESEYCIEMSARELCLLVARSSDLESGLPCDMNLQSKMVCNLNG